MEMFGDVGWAGRMGILLSLLLPLIAATVWLVRRFGPASRRTSARQPRLAVVDATTLDGRRKLVLVRRDDVEHLLMIGGPSDIVVEPNIVRAAVEPGETAGPRIGPLAEAVPRPAPLGKQPQHRPPLPAEAPQPIPLRTDPQLDDAPQVLALRTAQAAANPVAETDSNIAETAQRLKAALHRPPADIPLSPSEAAPNEAAGQSGREASEDKPPRTAARPSKQFYDSIEQEMSTLLGRRSGAA
jgi:flagellar protein FliO/FliZ